MCEPEAVRIPTTNYGTTVREIFHENKNREALIQCIASMLHLLSQLVHITIQSYAKLLLFNENVTLTKQCHLHSIMSKQPIELSLGKNNF